MDNQKRIITAKTAISNALGVDIETLRYEIVGSTYISDKVTSDVDILVFDPSRMLEEELFDGWAYGGSVGIGNDNWMSWKRTVDGVEVNMLLVTNEAYFNSWLTAAEVCRFLHLQGYNLRSASVHGVHEIIMDDSTADYEHINRQY